ncbi:hypothetical protein [Saccharophagus degradans]|uniref:Uncharacterized protein n=1 Tax=Saccharophagus degradans TaxID=86304 RepID=A0AAW7X6J5_9GAMM|nr:hypothetical protein [Saccharophagus degradans]MBU2983896.1 hypothetical protein [Saccharophagus degradans]MDO6422127.1 hypothetical protein [Saccharophagus degradans]MDO6609318.1 hypothetical protein [Saccharophagus degradans]WGO98016.1 hypothetical protein QFX18_18585 [Saccharophagus degradans]
MHNTKEPPLVLVKTWVSLVRSAEDEEVKSRACQMLIDAFGDMKAAADYCVRHNIQIS